MDGFVRDQAFSGDQGGDDRDPRDSLFLMGKLRLPDERDDREVRVRNLSERGAMVEIDRDVPIGTRVTVELRNIGAVAAEVVWTMAGRAGLALQRSIDPRRARVRVGSNSPVVPRR